MYDEMPVLMYYYKGTKNCDLMTEHFMVEYSSNISRSYKGKKFHIPIYIRVSNFGKKLANNFVQKIYCWKYIYKTMYRFSTFFSPILISRNEPQGLPRPLYKSKKKSSKVPFVGTLNLCLETPDTMQKTRHRSELPGLRKRPKTVEN